MNKIIVTVTALAVSSAAALAQSANSPPPAKPATPSTSFEVQSSIPAGAVTVTDWYKQNVYDRNDKKIGDIKDVLVDKSGKVTSLIVAVGGFLGAGAKDVAVPFDAVRATTKNNNKWYLVMNASKDGLKAAPGFTYDKTTTSWMPAKK
ncbi:MAG TPA: PRC-barrel domain-containing protein [Pirellulales bacterium]|nr:PRC-barrel domain-containing protein [Pirellulales bacterium]